MTRQQFQNLKPGDLVVWRGRYLRTILRGPAWPNGGITFAIRRRSWTNRASTTYFWNDVKDKIKFVGRKARGPLMKSELTVLEVLEFDVRRELKRELDEEKALAQRQHRNVCPGWARLKKLTKTV